MYQQVFPAVIKGNAMKSRQSVSVLKEVSGRISEKLKDSF